jgi:DNA integrity scanning protein DisA with diadenylate cyclase activity
MEELTDVDIYMENIQLPAVSYVAVYNQHTGEVISVGPSHAFLDEKFKLQIENETAERIINAELKIHNCFVDTTSNKLEIAEIKNLVTIDDVLHRVTSLKYSTVKIADVYITYNSKNKTLKIQLSSALGGTKKVKLSVTPQKIIWDNDAEMDFIITDYNDPNLIFEMFSVKIKDLINNTKIIPNIDYNTFSIYTKRLFKNYVIEYK